MIRSENEIRSLLETYQRHQKAISLEIDRCCPLERFNELAPIFNQNAIHICSLEWVLGGDSIKVEMTK